jgi:hypothetical protein
MSIRAPQLRTTNLAGREHTLSDNSKRVDGRGPYGIGPVIDVQTSSASAFLSLARAACAWDVGGVLEPEQPASSAAASAAAINTASYYFDST